MASIIDALIERGKPSATKGLLSPDKQDTPIGYGLLGDMTNPIAKAMMAYGFTGQGNDPKGAMLGAYIGETDRMAAQKAQAAALAKQKAQQAQIASMFAGGGVDPSVLAQYSMSGGEGAKDLVDMYKFGRTPQTFAPGQMMIDPSTGQMTMPAPKMGEGQMWDGQQVSEAAGYGDVLQRQIGRDLQKYQQQEGIDYGYDMGRMGQQNQYDIGKMGYKSGLDMAADQASLAYGAQLSESKYYDPQAGGMVIGNRYDSTQGDQQRLAERPSGDAQWQEGQIKEAQKYAATMRETASKGAVFGGQLSKLSELSDSINQGKVGALSTYIASIAPQLELDPSVSDAQAFQAIIQQIIPEMKVAGSGTFTDDDAKRMEQSLPSLSGDAEGRQKIISQLQEKLAMQQAEVESMEDYIATVGRLDDRYYRLRNDFYSKWGQ